LRRSCLGSGFTISFLPQPEPTLERIGVFARVNPRRRIIEAARVAAADHDIIGLQGRHRRVVDDFYLATKPIGKIKPHPAGGPPRAPGPQGFLSLPGQLPAGPCPGYTPGPPWGSRFR